MKKLTLFAAFVVLFQLAFAGGLLTNYNQSAQYIRMMSRNASLEIDAVFYNPAGLIKMENGWHFSVSSQTIFQDKTMSSDFPLLNESDYVGKVSVPVFPNAYAVYKMDKWAFSLGFGPSGGGGSAEFETGLPSFEIPIAQVGPMLGGLAQIDPSLAISGYEADLYLNGSSVFWGVQVGATYAINDVFSVYGGARILPSKNTYEGHIKDVRFQVGGQMYPAPGFLNQTAGVVNSYSAQAAQGATLMYGTAQTMNPIIEGGYGSATLADLENASVISAQQRALIEGGLMQMGLSQQQINAMNVTMVQGAYVSAGDELTSTSQTLAQTGATLGATASSMEDRKVNTTQQGLGITPIIGVNISPNDDWNIAIKYEHKTYLTLDNSYATDDNYGEELFGSKTYSDIPGIITVGVGYRGLDWLEAQLSFNTYLDKGVGWGGNIRDFAVSGLTGGQWPVREREIDNNYYEIALGLQFNLAENFAFSFGGLRSKSGIAESWQSDFSYSNSSFTLGGGIMWKITDRVTFDAGVSNTFYEEDVVEFTYPGLPDYNGDPITNYSDNYNKTTINFAAGLSFSIF